MWETLSYEDGKKIEPIVGEPFVPCFQPEMIVVDSEIALDDCRRLAEKAKDSLMTEIVEPSMAEHLAALMQRENARHWNIVITGMYQPPTLITYRKGIPVHSNGWHTDYAYDDRSKLGISVILENATDGGMFQYRYEGWNVLPEVGQAVIIPGYVPHRISSVNDGTRVYLVAWMGGPEFR